MDQSPDILCIGSVLWDVIGRHPGAMRAGDDRAGHITRQPGGVAMNIAMTLVQFGLRPALLTAMGSDTEGVELSAACRALGLVTKFAHVSDLPTDRYMAIEHAGGLLAAIADAHSLEAAGAAILAPLSDGRLGTADAPWRGLVALDGNLTEALLAEVAESRLFATADLRLAPASPGKAARLRPLLGHPRATLYVNLEEAGLLLGRRLHDSATAAMHLHTLGAARVLVTDGNRPAALADAEGVATLQPPEVRQARVTGAGDTFMAAHIAADWRGATRIAAFDSALSAAAAYVAGESAA